MRTILIVDDDACVRKAVAGYFEASGWRVLTAADGTEGLDVADRNDVDAVLSDVEMRPMNGIELCRRLRARVAPTGPTLPIWLMSGAASPALEIRALGAGARALLPKPFDSEKLLEAMNQAVGAAALESSVIHP